MRKSLTQRDSKSHDLNRGFCCETLDLPDAANGGVSHADITAGVAMCAIAYPVFIP